MCKVDRDVAACLLIHQTLSSNSKPETMKKTIGGRLDDVIRPIIQHLDTLDEKDEKAFDDAIPDQTFGIKNIDHLFPDVQNKEVIKNIIQGRRREIQLQQKLQSDLVGLKVIMEAPLISDPVREGYLLCDPKEQVYVRDFADYPYNSGPQSFPFEDVYGKIIGTTNGHDFFILEGYRPHLKKLLYDIPEFPK
eukprot:385530_1